VSEYITCFGSGAGAYSLESIIKEAAALALSDLLSISGSIDYFKPPPVCFGLMKVCDLLVLSGSGPPNNLAAILDAAPAF